MYIVTGEERAAEHRVRNPIYSTHCIWYIHVYLNMYIYVFCDSWRRAGCWAQGTSPNILNSLYIMYIYMFVLWLGTQSGLRTTKDGVQHTPLTVYYIYTYACIHIYIYIFLWQVTQSGLLSTKNGIADGFSREEDTRRARKIKTAVRARSSYVSRVRETAPALRVGCTLQLQRTGQEAGKWQCESLLGKGNWASVYLLVCYMYTV